jgi:hypothetical protein
MHWALVVTLALGLGGGVHSHASLEVRPLQREELSPIPVSIPVLHWGVQLPWVSDDACRIPVSFFPR